MKILILKLEHLPNDEGFNFIGVEADGQLSTREVMKNELGQFYVINFTTLIGWLSITANVLLK